MKVIGIIAEYNPFHKGHLYHLNTAKHITGSDYIIVVMSGNYTQRGEPAIFDKFFRTRQALINGADVVFELPSLFSTASAEGFAFGAVSLLHKLGVCDYLAFGSEQGDLRTFKEIGVFLNNEPEAYQYLLKTFLKQGLPFPKAREKSLSHFFPNASSLCHMGSNDILALEYCRALDFFKSSISPIFIKRIDNQYNDINMAEPGKISSASAIRNYLFTLSMSDSKLDFSTKNPLLTQALPPSFYDMQNEKLCPLYPNDFSLLMHTKILKESAASLMEYLDISKELADRIINMRNQFSNIDNYCNLLKTKEITYSRISRSLMHIFLEITENEFSYYKNKEYCPYGRILGFRKEAAPLLHRIKKEASFPLITKTANASKLLNTIDYQLFEKEILYSHLYQAVVSQKYNLCFKNEYTRPPVII